MDTPTMNVITTNVDSDTLSAEKVVSIESKQDSTPAKALQVGKLRASEDVSDLAHGFAEIYIKANRSALENSRNGWENLRNNLSRQAKRANDNEIVVPFVQYDEREGLSPENAAEIARLESSYGDIIPVPLMTPLVNAADDGADVFEASVSTILDNAREFLEAVDRLNIEKPVMGVIPPISKECTRALLRLYSEHGLSAYCVDFNRRSPMARTQLDSVITPLMATLESYGKQENSLLYAINAPEHSGGANTHQTPTALCAYTLGFDVIGDQHIPPRFPPEVFENIETKNELRLFDEDTLSVVEVPPEDLSSFLPDKGKIPVERVQRRIESNKDEKFRYEKLINAELISLYLNKGIDVTEISGTPQGTAIEATIDTTLYEEHAFSSELLFEVPALIVESVLSTGKARTWFTGLDERHQRSVVNLMLGSVGFYLTGNLAVVALSPLIAPSVHQIILREDE